MANAPPTRGTRSAEPALTDDIIIGLATDIPREKYNDLSVKLKITLNESTNILESKHHGDVKQAVTEILMKWKNQHGSGHAQKEELHDILESIKLGDLAAKIRTTTVQDLNVTQGFTLLKCRQMLADRYMEGICKVKIKPWEKEGLVNVNQIYTVVTMYKKDASGKNLGELERKVLDGSVDDIFKAKINGVLPKRIAIYAGAGKGKTTAVAKMAYDWANDSPGSPLTEVPLLFILRFRFMNNEQSLGHAIISELLGDVNNLTPESLEKFIRENQDLCWIILDGYDEYSGRLSNEQRETRNNIMSIVKNKYLTQCRVAVTSRPHLEREIDNASNVYAKMEIEGFSIAYAHTYIERFFVQGVSKGQQLKDYLKQHDIIREFILTPLLCVMVCYLWRDNRMPKINTVTKLFDAIVLFLWGHLREKGEYSEIWFLETKKALGAVALKGLVEDNDKLLFRREDFREHSAGLDNGIELGLITESDSPVAENAIGMPTKSQKVIEFFHKSAQEYLAAMYLSEEYNAQSWFRKIIGRTQLDGVIKSKEKCLKDFENLLRFVAGTGTETCVMLMKATSRNTFLDKDERFRIILDLLTETHDFIGDVKGLLGMFALQNVILKSLTLYTVVGIKMLPDTFKSKELHPWIPNVGSKVILEFNSPLHLRRVSIHAVLGLPCDLHLFGDMKLVVN